MTNANGDVDLDFYFSIDDDAEVYQSCSITWNNQLYVYGGKNKRTQISKVTDCRLKRVGTLEFNHEAGDCVNAGDNRIYLCFDCAKANKNKCRVGSSPIGGLFNEIALSHYYHKRVDVILSILYLYFN